MGGGPHGDLRLQDEMEAVVIHKDGSTQSVNMSFTQKLFSWIKGILHG